MKKLILLLTFIPLFIQATEFTLVAKPGRLLFKTGEIYLKCADNSYDDCAYELDLPIGTYKYINLHDTTLIAVDSIGAYELGEVSDNIVKIFNGGNEKEN
jgi:hypothetical protein